MVDNHVARVKGINTWEHYGESEWFATVKDFELCHRPSTSTLRRWQIDRFAGAFRLFAGALIGLSAPLQTFAFDNLGANQEFGSSTLQLLESRASSIREMNMTSSIASREGQPVVAINPTNPDNIVFVSTRFHPLPELEPVGGCFLTYTLDRGITWNNVTAKYPLGTAPKCGEP
ncbi:bnr asp-box protein [Colletotrichum asianum]|uniref:Bnr asp-box protein n=1 Tax=Colletotrichum asianum TaxID=702518 RepID=A0A8H3W1L8_9PEZI|nr:bnr asp-box protein [Colletotrichum asianum]